MKIIHAANSKQILLSRPTVTGFAGIGNANFDAPGFQTTFKNTSTSSPVQTGWKTAPALTDSKNRLNSGENYPLEKAGRGGGAFFKIYSSPDNAAES